MPMFIEGSVCSQQRVGGNRNRNSDGSVTGASLWLNVVSNRPKAISRLILAVLDFIFRFAMIPSCQRDAEQRDDFATRALIT